MSEILKQKQLKTMFDQSEALPLFHVGLEDLPGKRILKLL